ncbi:hypothetical protein SAMN05216179_1012 [Gracilibacillus kekensis]|uniref:Uncharacterized protein n=1 Tax=Gracilibacillus kekensis TaxID=1027249 RepID=A0A1M7LAX7_9BACI|nr:hypothetical protein SAMN05216179_1012 [Gracilibacillus kekensis]
MSKELEKTLQTNDAEGCCGGPAPSDTDACCVDDANAKAAGDDGCGCDSTPKESPNTSSCC